MSGVILGVEMSRLARSCKDWYQLLELCALFGTLICDLDGLYDPACYNDRLLLGPKGGATYPTIIPHSRPPGRYPRGAPPRSSATCSPP